jgi:DNA polymerase III subunit delta
MIIFLYGEDAFRSHQKLLEIKQKYLDKDKSASGLSFCDAESNKKILKDIKENFETSNLFSSKRLMIVKNILSATNETEQKEILEYLKKNKKKVLEDKDAVAVFWESALPKKTSLFKFLNENTKKQNFEKLTGQKLTAWTMLILKDINPSTKISPAALQKFLSFTGENSSLIYFELQKISAYADKNTIGENDVDLLVKANINSNIFATIEALGANNKKEALELIHAHLEKGDDPFYLLSMIAYQFRTMLKIADLAQNINSEYEISQITKLHPFVVKKNLSQIKYFSLDKLKNIFRKLSRYDFLLKTGKLDARLALDKLVTEL